MTPEHRNRQLLRARDTIDRSCAPNDAPPSLDPESAKQMRALISKGASGFAAGFTTDDIHGLYERLKAQGVEFTQEPVEQVYGTDVGLRDPFGNQLRITQMNPEFTPPV